MDPVEPTGARNDGRLLAIVEVLAHRPALVEPFRRRSGAPSAHVRVFYGSTVVGNVTALDHHDILDRVGTLTNVFQKIEAMGNR